MLYNGCHFRLSTVMWLDDHVTLKVREPIHERAIGWTFLQFRSGLISKLSIKIYYWRIVLVSAIHSQDIELKASTLRPGRYRIRR